MIDTWLDSLTPRIVRRWAIRVLFVAMPIAVIAFIVRAAGWFPEGHGPTVIMTYGGGLLIAVAAGSVAALSTCHQKIARAFGAGYQAGRVNELFEDERRPALHVVGDHSV